MSQRMSPFLAAFDICRDGAIFKLEDKPTLCGHRRNGADDPNIPEAGPFSGSRCQCTAATWPLILDDGECLACIVKKKRCLATGAQIAEKTRPTSHPAIAQPAPVKKPTQNQTPIW
jgi:hypothetical protein